MKLNGLLLSLLLLLLLPLAAAGETHEMVAASRMDSVTVFPDRAQVSRSAQLSLKAGTNFVTFEALPRGIAEDSIRVEGKGAGRAQIAGITVKTVYLERIREQRVHELEEEIDALNRKVESIDARGKALTVQEAFLESIKVGWGERISKELSLAKPSLAELGDAMKFVGDGVGKIEEQRHDLESAKKPLLERIAALKKELAQNRREGMKEVRSVLVTIEADRDMRFVLNMSYLVGDAHWVPGYDVRLSPDGKEAELVYRAQVWQKTGEDWRGVKLSLSTASPEVGGAPPELRPWHVSFYEPPVPEPRPYARAMAAPSPKGAAAVYGGPIGSADTGVAEEQSAVPQTAEVAEGQSSVVFNIIQPADIPTNGTRSGSIIAITKLPVTAEYQTVPKLSPRAYLKSVVANNTNYPLLRGEVNVFNDTAFTGKTYLPMVNPGEKFDLFFGADNQIKVKREVAKIKKQGGLIGSSSVSYRCSVELQNFKKQAVKLSVLDQLPLPENAEIKVSLDDASPKPDETKDDGTLVWKVTLAPGEKKKISYEIVIEYPKGRRLTGAE
jgi:uncharacterized protein (TIGR02231 family)